MSEGKLGFSERCKLKDELRDLESAFSILQYSNAEMLGYCRIFKMDGVDCANQAQFRLTDEFQIKMYEYIKSRIDEIKIKLEE
jgi:hypothetical protein